MLDVCFTVEVEHEKTEDIPVEILLQSLQNRINYLYANRNECGEAFGFCDVYSFEEEERK